MPTTIFASKNSKRAKSRVRRSYFTSVVLGVVLSANIARAEQTITATAPAVAAESPPVFLFAADLGAASVSETNATTVLLSPLLDGQLVVDPALAIDLAWGFIWAVDGQGSTARVGNPALSATYRLSVDELVVHATVGITAPLASYRHDPDGRLYAFDYNQTMAMWGMWNSWLWTPDRMASPIAARIDRRFGVGGDVRGEIGIAPVFGMRGDASGTATFFQAALEGGLPIGDIFVLRPRVQVVVLPSASVDRSQTALGLRGVLRTRCGSYFGGLLVNLDKPYGIFGGLERWGLHLGKEIGL